MALQRFGAEMLCSEAADGALGGMKPLLWSSPRHRSLSSCGTAPRAARVELARTFAVSEVQDLRAEVSEGLPGPGLAGQQSEVMVASVAVTVAVAVARVGFVMVQTA